MSNLKLKTQNFINLNREKRNRLIFNKPGIYSVYFENLSGDLIFEIREKNVNLNIYGLYIGKKTDSFQLKTQQYHLAPQSTSNLLIKGVFDDQSKFVYQGLIRIEKQAQRSHAYQKNQNLVLSSQVFIDSKPYLEILADDVYCTHGSSTGRPDKEQIYYLQTRGISPARSERLLIDGFIREIKSKIHYAQS